MATQATTRRANCRGGWDRKYAQDRGLKARVESLLNEMELEQDLVALREKRGLSQTAAAKLLGVSQPAVAKLESGKVKNAKISAPARYAAALGGRLKVEIVPDPTSRGRKIAEFRHRAAAKA